MRASYTALHESIRGVEVWDFEERTVWEWTIKRVEWGRDWSWTLEKRSPNKNGCTEDTLTLRERDWEREENLYNPRVKIFSHLK